MPQINYIRGRERVTVDHENKTVFVQDRFKTWEPEPPTQTDYAAFVSVKDNFRDNDNPYVVVDDEGTYVAIPFCAETEQDKINHKIFANSK